MAADDVSGLGGQRSGWRRCRVGVDGGHSGSLVHDGLSHSGHVGPAVRGHSGRTGVT